MIIFFNLMRKIYFLFQFFLRFAHQKKWNSQKKFLMIELNSMILSGFSVIFYELIDKILGLKLI